MRASEDRTGGTRWHRAADVRHRVGMTPAATIRPATLDDIDELVRLRALMFEYMGDDPRLAVWAKTAAAYLEETLADGTTSAFVADVGGSRLAGCGVGTTCTRLPGPNNPNGRYGYIASMVTDRAFRRQGLARGIFVALLAWFGERDIHRVDLHATAEGAPLYRSFGFAPHEYGELRWSSLGTGSDA
jgi:GNAT superfamily N-acetyltransferase